MFNWTLARAAQTACILEVDAPKVGNVNRYHDFEDCSLEDFHLSALTIGQAFGNLEKQGVGRTVYEAVLATGKTVATNTNLGILLLLVPLGMAWCRLGSKPAGPFIDLWRVECGKVLDSLTVKDTGYVYRAIRAAAPSGLGEVGKYDVNNEESPQITLLEAMRLAADRDLVAGEYASGFESVFTKGYQVLKQSLAEGLPLAQAIAQTHLFLLCMGPDTLIVRKRGQEAGNEVQRRACLTWELGGWSTPEGRKHVEVLDHWLRTDGHGLNPGSTADLTAAAIFVWLLDKQQEEEEVRT